MKIAFITNEFISEPNSFDGGLSNYIFKVCVTLIEYGHFPIVFVLSDENKTISYSGIEVHRVKPKINFVYKLIDKITMFKCQQPLTIINNSYYINRKLRKVNKTKKIDIVQYPSYQAIGLFVPRNIPSLMRISSYQKLIDEANGFYYSSYKDRFHHVLEDITYKRAKNLIGPSYFLSNFISKKFKKNVKVIESPYDNNTKKYDTTIIDRIKKETNSSKFGLFYGRLAQLKGLVEIANILEKFFENNPSFYFVIIGKDLGYKGSPSLDFINSKLKKNRDKLIYFKEQNHEKLLPVIKKAEFVLMPSRIENFPNACVEAMSLSKIVIASKGISFEQLINDKENGFLFENANSKDLLKVIEQVLNLPSERKKEIQENAKKIVERLHPDITVNKLINYYQSIIK